MNHFILIFAMMTSIGLMGYEIDRLKTELKHTQYGLDVCQNYEEMGDKE